VPGEPATRLLVLTMMGSSVSWILFDSSGFDLVLEDCSELWKLSSMCCLREVMIEFLGFKKWQKYVLDTVLKLGNTIFVNIDSI
jgi:hypothetical protein